MVQKMCIHVYRGTTKPDSLWALWWRGWAEQVLGKISAVEKWNSLHFCITRVQNSYGFRGHVGLKQHKCFLHITGSDDDGDEDWEDLPAVWIEVFLLFWAFWLKLFVNLRWKSQGLQICGLMPFRGRVNTEENLLLHLPTDSGNVPVISAAITHK